MSHVEVGSDGLPVRVIKPHTLEKYDRHENYCGIFTSGMKDRWRGSEACADADEAIRQLEALATVFERQLSSMVYC